MLNKDIDPIRQQHSSTFSTKSENPNVLEVYTIVVQHQNADSDYWTEEHGSGDLIQVFRNRFSAEDWKDLQTDLPNWSNDQLQLFTIAILNGYHAFTNEGVYYGEPETVKEVTRTVPERFDLLLTLLQIDQERNPTSRPLATAIAENLHFINDHFHILLDHHIHYFEKIREVAALLRVEESDREEALDLKEKILLVHLKKTIDLLSKNLHSPLAPELLSKADAQNRQTAFWSFDDPTHTNERGTLLRHYGNLAREQDTQQTNEANRKGAVFGYEQLIQGLEETPRTHICVSVLIPMKRSL